MNPIILEKSRNFIIFCAFVGLFMLASCSHTTKPIASIDHPEFRALANQISERINNSNSVFEYASALNSNAVQSSGLTEVRVSGSNATINEKGILTFLQKETTSSEDTRHGKSEQTSHNSYTIPLQEVQEIKVLTYGSSDKVDVKQVKDAKMANLTTKKSFIVVAFTNGKKVTHSGQLVEIGIPIPPNKTNGARIACFQSLAKAQAFARDFQCLVSMTRHHGTVKLTL